MVAIAFIGIELRQVGDPWGLKPTRLFGVEVQQRHLAMLITAAVVVFALFSFFRFTRMGLAMRAAAYDQEAALAQGVSVGGRSPEGWPRLAAPSPRSVAASRPRCGSPPWSLSR